LENLGNTLIQKHVERHQTLPRESAARRVAESMQATPLTEMSTNWSSQMSTVCEGGK
jgi:hypothetical protein